MSSQREAVMPAFRILLTILAVLAGGPLSAAEDAADAPKAGAEEAAGDWKPVMLSGASRIDLTSKETGRAYRIFISMPEGTPPPAGWPVIYVLDGNAYFPTAHTLALVQAELARGFGLPIPQPVVVAIGSPEPTLLDEEARSEDYTPPAPDLSHTGDRRGHAQGGADRFLAFIETELKPRVESRIAIDRARQSLIGHSYGGLFALHVLFTKPDAFRTYVAGSPSIWWNDRYILTEKERFLAGRKDGSPETHLLLTVGSAEQQPVPGRRGAMIEARRMIDNARELADSLADTAPSLSVTFREFDGEKHYSSALPMLQLGFDFIARGK